MFRKTVAVLAVILASGASLSAQTASDEATAWAAAQASGTSEEVFAFIEAFPESEHVTAAKALMIDLLWVELGEDTAVDTETPAQEEVVSISFSAPLTEGSPDIIGKSLEDLIKGTPLFPPVEGLPEEYWKSTDCSSCHAWEQANLCTQANSYLNVAGAENLTKQHPYGGTFKLNLRNWAMTGCE